MNKKGRNYAQLAFIAHAVMLLMGFWPNRQISTRSIAQKWDAIGFNVWELQVGIL